MSASLSIDISLQGTKDELFALIKVFQSYETVNEKQYRVSRDCAYISLASLNQGTLYLKNSTDEEINALLDTCDGTVHLDASGPSGVYNDLDDVRLFETMADAAPTARFKGDIYGDNGSGELGCNAELKDGKLYLSEYFLDDADRPEYDDEDPDFDEDELYEELEETRNNNSVDRIYDPLTEEYHIWWKEKD